ncbi:MAG: Xaa-Pro dipeptidase [Gammaproteobacteria bacterium]|jgi:Xaa-Pro dipeptidase|nr:Xaa-Pro dipeptidase [Gammaproteobacteria bacterium]
MGCAVGISPEAFRMRCRNCSILGRPYHTRTAMLSRRAFLHSAAATSLLARTAFTAPTIKSASVGGSITGNAKPISAEERHMRLAKVQTLMAQQKIAAMLVEPGSTLDYFTGVRWRRSERTTLAIIPANGQVVVITPAFEEPSVRETLQVGGDVRPWDEHENPFEKVVQALKDRGISAGVIAAESTTRFFIIAGIHQASSAYEIIPADALVRACRLIKSPAELALLQLANDVTIEALRQVHAKVSRGMGTAEIAALMDSATLALGAAPEFSLVLLNEASAYPHGSVQPQKVRDGSVILMDCGCEVHGYQSDISRTWVVGEATAQQRKVWNTVKRGQEIALETAKIDVPVGSIDDAVRKHYESEGWGPGYRLPGLSHRTGHGIGMDVHEPAYLVHGDATTLAAGMCFSDEPGIYIPGQFGIRLEDCWYMTTSGPKLFTQLAESLDHPV